MSKPKWEDTEEIEDIPRFEDTVELDDEAEMLASPEDSDISKLESFGRGMVEGGTLGLGDEVGSALLTSPTTLYRALAQYVPGTPEATDRELREQGFTGDVESELNPLDVYRDLRDTTREANKRAREANKGTYLAGELAGGIAPALATGGASAAAGVTRALGKKAAEGALKQAVKESAKAGAKYGAGAGFGYSEADLTEGDIGGAALDTAIGAGLGGTLGAGIPIAGKGVKTGAKYVTDKAGQALDVLPGSEFIKAAYKYGKLGRKISQEALDEDLKQVSSGILSKVNNLKAKNNINAIKEELNSSGIKVNTKKQIENAIKDLRKIQKGDLLDVQNKKILKSLEKLAPMKQTDKMLERLKKQIIKKKVESEGAETQALIKAEKQIAKMQETGNFDVSEVDEIMKVVDDIGGDIVTSEGALLGKQARFEPSGEGEAFTKKILSDTTPYQPETTMMKVDGRPVLKTVDLGSGKITAMVGEIEKRAANLRNMTIEQVENLRSSLNTLIKSADDQADPAVRRAMELATELKTTVDTAIAKSGSKDLISKRAKMSDILSAEDLLGMRKKGLPMRSDLRREAQVREIGSRLGFEQGFKTRAEAQQAEKLLGRRVFNKPTKEKLDIIKSLNKISGRETQETATTGSLYKSLSADLPNVFGRAARQIEKKVVSPVQESIAKINSLGVEKTTEVANKLINSGNKGQEFLGQQLLKAAQLEGPAREQLLWSLSQSNAFRELIKRELGEFDSDIDRSLSGEEKETPKLEDIKEGDTSRNIMDILNPISSAYADDLTEQKPVKKYLKINTNNDILDEVIGFEKGYQNDPNDTGNFLNGELLGTNFGITPKAYKNYYGEIPTVDDIKNLTEEEAREIYNNDYITKPKMDLITDNNLKLAAIDFGVNSGPTRAIKELQKIVGTKVDGKLGPKTIKKIENYEGDLVKEYLESRKKYLKSLNKPRFIRGWLNRINQLEETIKENKTYNNIGEDILSELNLDQNYNQISEVNIPYQENSRLPSSTSPVMDAKSKLDALLKGYADQPIPTPQRQPQELKSQLDSLIKEGTELSKTAMDRMMDGVDRITRMISSGDSTPVDQIDDLVGQVDDLQISDEDKEMLVDQIFEIQSVADAQRVKDMLRGLMNETGTVDN